MKAKPGKKHRQSPGSTDKGFRLYRWPGLLILVAALLSWLSLRGLKLPRSAARWRSVPSEVRAQNDQKLFATYAGSESCKRCHEEEFKLWAESNHALAERNLSPAVDSRAFAPSRVFGQGVQSTRVAWTNGALIVTSVGPSGSPQTFSVARVIGNTPLRQFLVAFPGGRWQALEAAYDPRSNQWFDVYGTEQRKPGEWGHWTGRGMNWNFMCASCHNTRLRRNYDASTDSYQTRMAEIGVGCEACHGPLRAHNQWQKQFGGSGRKDPTLARLNKQQTLDTCGFCHGRRTELRGDFKPGDDFFDDFALATVGQDEHYYADGQVRDEDYEYGSFLGSRMHQRGVVCTDCHNPHSMKTLLPGNWLCLRCHGGGNTNAPLINPVTHSHHQVFGFSPSGQPLNVDLKTYRPERLRGSGGECVNCHMPQTVYMQRHWRHDHGFTCPDPLLTKQFGIPNACNRCHRDKDADWALKFCDQWFGEKMNRATRQRAQLVARAQKGESSVCDPLLSWLKHEETPYWQAVIVGLLSQWGDQEKVAVELERGLHNPNALVRSAAAQALAPALAAGRQEAIAALQRCLEDPVRSVRVAAGSVLQATLEPSSPAGRDFQAYLDDNADEPGGQVEQALYYFSRNQLSNALPHLEKAVQWDPYDVPIRQELAVLLSAMHRPAEAIVELKQACSLAPQDAESHYKLGLAYNEAGNLAGAAEELQLAVRLNPQYADGWYNLGLAQNALGRTEAALESLSQAEVVAPSEARIPYARATILLRLGRRQEAASEARRTLFLAPGFSPAQQLLQSLGK